MLGMHLSLFGLTLDVTHCFYGLCALVMWGLIRMELLRRSEVIALLTLPTQGARKVRLTLAGLITLLGGLAWLAGSKLGRAFEQFGFSTVLAGPLAALRDLDGTNGLPGMIAAILMSALLAVIFRRRPLATLDALAPALAAGYAIGRLGCFAAGHCFGLPTKLPWGVRDPMGYFRYTPVHPTPMYEALIAGAIFAVLWRKRRNSNADGSLFGCFLWSLGTERLLVEVVRRNPTGLGGLSQAQWIALAMIGSGLLLSSRPARGAATT